MREYDIYPLVVVKDRYNGTYSKGAWTAWNEHLEDIPQYIDDDDITCMSFWKSNTDIVGLGRNPDEAIVDLKRKLDEK